MECGRLLAGYLVDYPVAKYRKERVLARGGVIRELS